jgi:predicted Zn-dependent protease
MNREQAMKPLLLAIIVSLAATPAFAQFGAITKGMKQVQRVEDMIITDQEEQDLGSSVSTKIRQQYGVVQDEAVHKYVSLVGTVLAQASTRPTLKWQFIVLDTDGVNAFAAPGGFVHITRGALGLIRSEGELAGVLAHEIVHVTEKHTLNAIKKNKAVQIGTSEALGDKAIYLDALANKTYEMLLENAYDRGDEQKSDKIGIQLANKLGYAPSGLGTFLQKLGDRNKGATQKRGLFASHPDLKDRIDRMAKQIKSEKLTSAATVEARYLKFITYEAKAQTEIATVMAGSAGVAGGTTKAEEPKKEEEKKKGFGLGSLMKPSGSEKQSAQVTASAGARGVDPERDAKGGSTSKPVVVTLTAAEIAEFKKGIAG